MLLGALLQWSFTANIISTLLTRVMNLPFNDIQSLVEKTNYLISVFPGSSQVDRFKLSSDIHDQRAYAERIKPYLDDFERSYAGKVRYICM